MISLNNKFALVTGSSRGLGKATALSLANYGADIFIHYNKSYDEAKSTVNIIKQMGRNAYLLQGDLSKYEDVKRMFSELNNYVDTLDILVNNAGVGNVNFIRFITEGEWDNTIDINLKGTFLCSKFYSKLMMKKNTGCIINISSGAVFTPGVKQLCYVTSKAGINAMTRVMAKELGPFGIRVNAVSPGPINTGMNKMSEEDKKNILGRIALNRICETDDVTNVIVFLCSSMADYVTGQIIQVDGGLFV